MKLQIQAGMYDDLGLRETWAYDAAFGNSVSAACAARHHARALTKTNQPFGHGRFSTRVVLTVVSPDERADETFTFFFPGGFTARDAVDSVLRDLTAAACVFSLYRVAA